jgi:hypothetical protein
MSEQKFRELILYLARASQEDPYFGATKLNKLLFFCDFLAYRTLGRSISGEAYMRLDYGPAPRRLLAVRRELLQFGDCTVERRGRGRRQQERLVAQRDPNLAAFSREEIALIEQVLAELGHTNASEVSELSHRFIGWQAVGLQEEIPYETVFVGAPEPPTEEDAAYARRLAAELGDLDDLSERAERAERKDLDDEPDETV